MSKKSNSFLVILLILTLVCFIIGYSIGVKSMHETQKRIEQLQQENE